jgi:hypothetical protein
MLLMLTIKKKNTSANTTQTTTHPCFAMGSPWSGYPLGGMLEPVIIGPCNCESNIKEKEKSEQGRNGHD